MIKRKMLGTLSKRTIIITILAVIVFFIACVGVAESLRVSNETAYKDTRDYVMRTLKLGMSEQQVYTVLSQVGTYGISPLPRDICRIEKPVMSDRKEIFIHSAGLHWYSMGLYVCFDDSGSLVYFIEIVS